MGLKKGQASEAYKQGKMERYNLRNLPPEKRKEISRKGVEARKANSARKKAIKEQLEILLSLDVKDKDDRAKLAELGIDPSEANNQMLIVTALFKRATYGDVQAFKQLYDIVNGTQDVTNQPPVINIYSANSKVEAKSEEDDEWADWEDEEDDEWE